MKLKFVINSYASKLLIMISVITVNCNSQDNHQDDFTKQRNEMVKSQIIARGIKDQNVINAMTSVERHLFVPDEYTGQAYGDYPLPIGEGQTISQPYIVALMTEVLELNKSDKVLEIGTGSGYQAAILGQICDSVFTVEIFESLAKHAENLLGLLGYDNISVKCGDGYEGWAEHGPYHAIIVTCSPTQVPHALQNQLAEGGKLVIPVGETQDQELVLFEKTNGKMKKKNIIPVRFVPMIDNSGRKY